MEKLDTNLDIGNLDTGDKIYLSLYTILIISILYTATKKRSMF